MTTTVSVKSCLKGQIPFNQSVTVQGWVKTRRDSKAGLSFIHLHDGSCFAPIQIIAKDTLLNYASEILKLTSGASIIVKGTLIPSPSEGQASEIEAESVTVTGFIDDPETYPIQPKRHSLEFLRDVAHLRPRTNTLSAVTRVRHQLAMAIHQFFNERGFFWVHTPIITASDCEGAGAMFRVSTLDLQNLPHLQNGNIDFSKDFFGKETFLTVSGQLNVEAYCLAMSKVYTFGPTFRAENSHTSRHLAEFWMIEPEVAFANLDTIATLSKELLQYVCQYILDHNEDDMAFFDKFIEEGVINKVKHIAESDFARLTYTEAVTQLLKSGKSFQFPVEWGIDLQSEHERYLAEEYCKKPVILTDYPKDIKSFYMKLNDDDKTVACMDVLAPGIGEIIGGSAREDNLQKLDSRMIESGLSLDSYQWYRDLRRYGSVPHAGFGLGFERLISYITGVNNVRDVIPFPRTPGNAGF
jgi:asparaginyl-tRNA synthetase